MDGEHQPTSLDPSGSEIVGPWPATRHVARPWSTNPDQRGPSGSRPNQADRLLVRITVEIPQPIADRSVTLSSRASLECEEARSAVAELEAVGGLRGLADLLSRSEAVASSRIEAVNAEIDDWARASIGAEASESARQTMAAVEALGALTTSCDDGRPLTEETILAAHRALMDRDMLEREYAGRYRTQQNWLGGSDHSPRTAVHIPPPPGHVAHLMTDLLAFANRDDIPAIAQAAIAHGQFEAIHPFTDGNGRIGRALISAMHRRRAVTTQTIVPVAAAMLADIDAYFEHLVDYRNGDVIGLISYVARSTRDAAVESMTTAQRLGSLPRSWVDAVGARRGSAARTLAERLVESPVLDISRAEALTDVTRARAYDAIDRLVDAGILEEITGGGRNRIWAAWDVLGELADLEQRIGRRSAPSSRWR